MSHDLMQNADGSFAYVGAREPAWHRLGKTYTDRDGLTVQEVLDDLDVGEIVGVPMSGDVITVNGVTRAVQPRYQGTYRVRKNGEVHPLGIVGSEYHIIQEREGFAFIDNVIDSGEALVSAAGLLNDGRRSFCCLRLPEGVLVGGQDAVDMYAMVTMGHDGSLSLKGAVTPIRTVCQNTVTAGLATAVQSFTIRHTKKAADRMKSAQELLRITYAYTDEWAAEMDKLVTAKVTKDEFDKMVERLYAPKEPNPSTRAKSDFQRKRDSLMGFWDAGTQDGIRGTAWGAWNSIVEWADWAKPVRNVPKGQEDLRRFERSLQGGVQEDKDNALVVIKAMAGVK